MLLNRGRPSVALDLKQAEAREVVLRLVETADVLVEGMRPGVTERLVIDGLTYQKLRRDQVDAAIPGLLDSVVRSANRQAVAS